MRCYQTASCKAFGEKFKSFLKRLAVVAFIQIIGWFLFTYIEEGFALTDCIFNQARIKQLTTAVPANKTEKELELYSGLNNILEGNLTEANFDIYRQEFKEYFKVKEVQLKEVELYEICTRWYLFTAITLTTVG